MDHGLASPSFLHNPLAFLLRRAHSPPRVLQIVYYRPLDVVLSITMSASSIHFCPHPRSSRVHALFP